MQRMWKQSSNQSVGLYDIRLHTKSPATKNYMDLWWGGVAAIAAAARE